MSKTTLAALIGGVIWAQVEVGYFKFSSFYFDDYDSAKKIPEKVKYLDLSLQKLTSVPDVSIFPNLEWLDISFNRFTSFGTSICKAKKLKYLNISGCYNVTSIPECFKELSNLDTLKMVDMRLEPAEVEKVKKLLPHTTIILEEKKIE